MKKEYSLSEKVCIHEAGHIVWSSFKRPYAVIEFAMIGKASMTVYKENFYPKKMDTNELINGIGSSMAGAVADYIFNTKIHSKNAYKQDLENCSVYKYLLFNKKKLNINNKIWKQVELFLKLRKSLLLLIADILNEKKILTNKEIKNIIKNWRNK